jgi:hypothetical protein
MAKRIEGAGFTLGQRVRVHPAHDRFPMGDQYGEVIAIQNVEGSSDKVRIRVLMDRSGHKVWFRPDYLMDMAGNVGPSQNPLGSSAMLLIGLAAVGVVGVIAYTMMSKPAAAAPAAPALPPIPTTPPATPVGAIWQVSDLNTALTQPGTFAIDLQLPAGTIGVNLTSAEVGSLTQSSLAKSGVTVAFVSLVNPDGSIASSSGTTMTPAGWPGPTDATPNVVRIQYSATTPILDLGEVAGVPARGVWKLS